MKHPNLIAQEEIGRKIIKDFEEKGIDLSQKCWENCGSVKFENEDGWELEARIMEFDSWDHFLKVQCLENCGISAKEMCGKWLLCIGTEIVDIYRVFVDNEPECEDEILEMTLREMVEMSFGIDD